MVDHRNLSAPNTLAILKDEFVADVLLNVENKAELTSDHIFTTARHLDELAAHDSKGATVLVPKTQLRAHPILDAILTCAPCDDGRRYASCAIIACKKDGHDKFFANLQKLANDWYWFFLLPCKHTIICGNNLTLFTVKQAYKFPSPPQSEVSNSSRDNAAYITTLVDGNRDRTFPELLRERHENRCAITGTGSIAQRPTQLISSEGRSR